MLTYLTNIGYWNYKIIQNMIDYYNYNINADEDEYLFVNMNNIDELTEYKIYYDTIKYRRLLHKLII
jgi:hypothetical protein